ncbi:MAG: Trp biosynthesis-associated membrane protein [Lacisediminihabitans sp.]
MSTLARRSKSLTLLAGILVSAFTLLAWTQDWVNLTVKGTGTAVSEMAVAGSTAAPDLSALSLAGFALVAALAISGPALRVSFGIVQAAIGIVVVASSIVALQNPIVSSAASVTKATGVSGATSIAALVVSVSVSAWPWIAVALGVLTTILGVFTAFTTRRWRGATRRYEPVGGTNSHDSANPVSDWDELSGGSDPTSR